MWVQAVFGGEYLEKLYGFNVVCKKNSFLHSHKYVAIRLVIQ